MKYLSLFILGSGFLLAVLAWGVFFVVPNAESSEAVIVVPVDPTSVRLENQLKEQAATYQQEIIEIDQTRSAEAVEFEARENKLNELIAAAQRRVDQLKQEQQTLLSQLDDLKAARTGQLATLQTDLEQSREKLRLRQQQLQTQLDSLQAELAVVDAQLSP